MQSTKLANMPSSRLRPTSDRKRFPRIRKVFFRPALQTIGTGKEINSLNSSNLLKLSVELNGKRMQALVDSGADANYISARAMEEAGLQPLRKQEAYPLHGATGQSLQGETNITHEVTRVTLRIQDHQEKIDLDVLGLAIHDVILGLP